MKILFVGKFTLFHDEEYIAKSFEMIGHEVARMEQSTPPEFIHKKIMQWKPDILLFTKWEAPPLVLSAIKRSKEWGMKSVCWLFDLYWGYDRQPYIRIANYFRADYLFTTDGGNDERWKAEGIRHQTVRQGIYKGECYLEKIKNPQGIVFVGSENPLFPERTEMIIRLKNKYSNFLWFGKKNTNAVRGKDLNVLFSKTKIVVGDSVYSPYYWSNRVVETLGRGGFLIHQEVEGIKKEFPYLVTYKRGDFEDLTQKIDYYIEHEDERQALIRKNHKWVLDHYTMDKKCAELISKL